MERCELKNCFNEQIGSEKMRKKKLLRGLTTDDYVHPQERDYMIDLEQSAALARVMDGLSDLACPCVSR